MSLKQLVEENVIVFFLSALLVGFLAGWGAYSAVLTATGRASVSNEKLKVYEAYETERDRLRQTLAETAERLRLLERIAPEWKQDMMAQNTAMEAENSKLREQLMKNRPLGKTFVSNVRVMPGTKSFVSIGDDVEVNFDYEIETGVNARISVFPGVAKSARQRNISFSPGSKVSGKGTLSKKFSLNHPGGRVTEISFSIDSDDMREHLYTMSVPVNIHFR